MSRKLVVTCDSDIEPDDLVPQYISTKAKLLELERTRRTDTTKKVKHDGDGDDDLEAAKLEAKIQRIENDVLFDRFVGEQQWKAKRIVLEKELANTKKQSTSQPGDPTPPEESNQEKQPSDDINDEAERVAAEILAENNDDEDDDGLGGLFDNLPQSEIDPTTGISQTVISAADGTKIVVRDFGKWTGVSPRRALEEACRSR